MTGPKNIKVGVMLPLHDKDGDGKRMVEYYRGLLLGCDRVNKDGISVDMHAWNVPNGSDINEVLKEKDAANLDIIIGPLYSTQVKPLAEFCQQHNTMMVIPFSITGNDVENYPNIYQVYEPQEDFDALTITKYTGPVGVYSAMGMPGDYQDWNPGDTLMATAFRSVSRS